MSELGFLGLGSMGSAMAGRLVQAGHTVRVWNRSPAASAALAAEGAVTVEAAADALAAAVSFSMLADDRAADEVLSVDAMGSAAGRVHVNMASLSPAMTDRLEQRWTAAGGVYVAAPVLGRPPVAAAGKLNIIAGGPPDAVAQVADYLGVLGARTWAAGPRPRTASVLKIAVNYTIIHSLQALAEGITLVESQGIDPLVFTGLLGGTLFGGVVHQGYGDAIAQRRYSPPGFAMPLGLKDLGLAEDIAREAGVELPSSPLLRAAFEAALADPELRQHDWAAMAEITRDPQRSA